MASEPIYSFINLLNIELIQRVQDDFARITRVGSVIYDLEGIPITRPSNFCGYCSIVRSTQKGLQDCMESDANLWKSVSLNKGGAIPCKRGMLMDGIAPIFVGGHRIAGWGIGQVRFEESGSKNILAVREYAQEIGVSEDLLVEEYLKTRIVDTEQFQDIIKFLMTLSGELSELALKNLQLKQEITSRAKADERYRSIVKNAIVGICEISNNGEFIYTNDQLVKVLGYTKQELLGKKFPSLWNSEHKIESYFQGIVDYANKSYAAVGYDLKGSLKKKDGTMLPCRICLTPQKSFSNHIIKSSVVVIDTSAEQKALTTLKNRNEELQEKHRQLDLYFNSNVNALCIYNFDLKREKYNPAYRRIVEILGYKKFLDTNSVWEPIDSGILQEIITGERENYDDNHEFGMKLFSMNVEPIIDIDTARRKLLMTIKDITDYQLMMEKTLFSERMAGMGMLASGLAHDLKGVFAILGNSFITLEKLNVKIEREDVRNKYYEIIQDQKESLNYGRKLLRKMISFSGRSSGTVELFSLWECVDDIKRMFGGTIKEKNAVIKVNVRKEVYIYGIKFRLLHVLLNLLSNALEAITNNGVIRITESCTDHFFKLCISDSGCGIPNHDLDNIFRAFYSMKESGTGFGLFSTRNALEVIGGNISVDSAVGEGTTFIIEIRDCDAFQTSIRVVEDGTK